nr:reverse transcriptase N-terminal domain-containing protein [Paraburkholderia sp. Ac-20347]
MRIAKATREGRWDKVKALQRLLTRSAGGLAGHHQTTIYNARLESTHVRSICVGASERSRESTMRGG